MIKVVSLSPISEDQIELFREVKMIRWWKSIIEDNSGTEETYIQRCNGMAADILGSFANCGSDDIGILIVDKEVPSQLVTALELKRASIKSRIAIL